MVLYSYFTFSFYYPVVYFSVVSHSVLLCFFLLFLVLSCPVLSCPVLSCGVVWCGVVWCPPPLIAFLSTLSISFPMTFHKRRSLFSVTDANTKSSPDRCAFTWIQILIICALLKYLFSYLFAFLFNLYSRLFLLLHLLPTYFHISLIFDPIPRSRATPISA